MCGRVTAQSSPELKAAAAAASLVGRKVRVSSASQRIGTALGTAFVGTIGSIKEELPEDENWPGAGPVFYVDMEKSHNGLDMPAQFAGTELAAVFLLRDEFELLDEQGEGLGIVIGSKVRVTKLDNVEMWIDPSVEVGSVGAVLSIDSTDDTADVQFDEVAQYIPLKWLELVN